MSISSEITRINNNIASAYTACNSKGATMPATQNSANLATCINSISGGSATLTTKNITANGTYNASSDNADGYSSVTVNVPNPSTGTLSITQNGTYDVTNYASANVSVSGGGINLLTARYLSNDGLVSLSFDEDSGYYGTYVLMGSPAGRIFGQYHTILLGTTSDQISSLISFMQDLYNVKDQGLESLYYSIFYDDYGYTYIPILLPSLNTIEVYDFDSGNLQWTLTLEN